MVRHEYQRTRRLNGDDKSDTELFDMFDAARMKRQDSVKSITGETFDRVLRAAGIENNAAN